MVRIQKHGFIYITKNNIDGKSYIGKCQYGRANGWKTYLGSGTYLKRAITKYGKENFTRFILAEADTEEELRELEEYYIKISNAVLSEDFYNLKDTSIGGDTFTNHPNKEEIRKKKSYNASGKRNPMYGKPKSKKTIDAIKKANSREIEIDGIRYPSTAQASRELGINGTTIGYRLDSENFPTYIRIKGRKMPND